MPKANSGRKARWLYPPMLNEAPTDTCVFQVVNMATAEETNPFDDLTACIKSEITIEPEQVSETVFLEYNPEQLYQVEVQTSQEKPLGEYDNLDEELPKLQRACDITLSDGDHEDLNESQLSDVLSDHNYTTRKPEPQLGSESIKDALLKYIVPLSQKTVPDKISDFINVTVDSIKQLQLNAIESIEKTPATASSNAGEQHESESKHLTADASQEKNVSADKTPSMCMSPTITTNCSEPLENALNDEYFESLYENINDIQAAPNSVVNNTLEFAKQFYEDCKKLTYNTDEELHEFLKQKIRKLQEIANIGKTTDAAVQTYFRSDFKKRRENRFAKRKLLLDSSDTSQTDSDGSSYDADHNSESEMRKPSEDILFTKSKHKHKTEEETAEKQQNSIQDYSDGIDLTVYIKLEYKKKCRSSSSESDKENKEGAMPVLSDGNDTDKEIQRLTNLSGLSKRHAQHKNSRLSDEDSIKPKTLGNKNINSFEVLSEEELEASDSEKSFKQSDDEVITEDQYLSRYNEQIKMQLLNESDSDSGLSDQSEYNLSKESSSEENENKQDIVDKFLETFESDAEADESNDVIDIKSENEQAKKDTSSSKESDDLWSDNTFLKKRTKAKSFDKMLSEAEKRNKSEEIVLSSESEYSDVETVEAEPVEEKSRFIKPLMRSDQLANETRRAQKSENERIRRLDKKHSVLAKAIKNNPDKINESDLVLDYIESTKTLIKVHENIVKQLKAHQVDGIKFMYDSCYGGANHKDKNSGSGCILAHCMGLGKTLQIIALLHTLISYKELNTSKILVLCPKSTVMNWADEMQRWLGPINKSSQVKVFAFSDSSDITEKLRILEDWTVYSKNKAGCLLVGYEAFRTLVFYHSYKNRGCLSPGKLENIRESVNKHLLQPGADIVVCDEGHIIKNGKSAISLAVSKINTPKRIILTGTPIQNNLKEYYSMVNFIKPLYLGTEKEFANLYANPIKNGQHKDSSNKDITVMKQRSYVLHKKLSKFVQRKEAEVLKGFLPQKFEYVLNIPMTPVQNKLYEYTLEAIASRGDSRGKSLITDYTVLRKIWTHPKVLEDAWKNAISQKNKRETKKPACPHSDDDQPDDIYDSQTGSISVTNDWWRRFLSSRDLETILPSNKLQTMFAILRMCEEKGEKCLIFSAFVAVLNVVEFFFKKITEGDPEILHNIHIPSSQQYSNTWINGQDYYRLDGKTSKNIRHEMIQRFNSSTNMRARVFLISSKAGGQGINLIGANRVIILDTSWNPSSDQQNIFRIFRLGQKKNCYIYRLIAMGTMEEKVYSRSVTKQAMSFRVVDEQQIDRHYNMSDLAELYTLTIPQKSERPMPILPKDTILAHLLMSQADLVYKYHEHDSLLINKEEQNLSDEEKKEAWVNFDIQEQMNLAQQEGINPEKNPNLFGAAKMPPYMGSVPSLEMHALLNYSLQSAAMVPQYNYGLGQTYLEALNMFQKYPAMRYPDVNSCMGENNAFAPPPYPALNAPNHNHIPTSASILSSMQNIANNKSLQSDFGMFDMNMLRNNRNNNSQQSLPALPRLGAHTLPEIPTSAIPTTGTNLENNNLLSTMGQQYKMLENPLSSLLNYSNHGYPSTSTLPPVGAAASGNQRLNPLHYSAEALQAMTNAFATQAAAAAAAAKSNSINNKEDSVDKRLKTKLTDEQNSIQKSAVPQDIAHNLTIESVSLSPDLARINAQRAQNSPVIPKPSLAAATAVSDIVKSAAPSKVSSAHLSMQRQKNLNGTPNSFADEHTRATKVTRANTKVGLPLSSTLATRDMLKGNGDVQIIPTTSPPGTSSISKQLNEMSPSISVTAVDSTRETASSRTMHYVPQKNTNTLDNASTGSKHNNVNMLKSAKKVVYPNTGSYHAPGIQKKVPMSISTVHTMPTTTTAATSAASKVPPVSVGITKTNLPNPPTNSVAGSAQKKLPLKSVDSVAARKLLPAAQKNLSPQGFKLMKQPANSAMSVFKTTSNSNVLSASTQQTQRTAQKLPTFKTLSMVNDKLKFVDPRRESPNNFGRKRPAEEVKAHLNPKRQK